jgi:hypothetical protein
MILMQPYWTQITGTLLFYARALDNTVHVALGTLAAAQTQGTVHTMKAAMQLLNYAATHPDGLYIHSDVQYPNGPIHVESRIMKNDTSAASGQKSEPSFTMARK